MKKHFFPLIILCIVSFAPFLWGYGLHAFQFMGSGDFLSVINAQKYFNSVFYVFEQNVLAGADLSFLGGHFVPLFVFYWFFSLCKLSPFIITLLFLSFIIFVSQISMYCFLTYVFERKIQFRPPYVSVLSLFGALLYGFSPYIIGLISPGHVLLLVAYAFFPLILKTFDQLITDNTFNFRYWFYLFLLFMACASSFANVGSPAGIMIALAAYSVLSHVFAGIGWKRLVSRFTLTGVTVYLSNAWWMTPYFLAIRKTIALNEASGGIPGGFGEAAVKASVANILFGRAEYLIHIVAQFNKYMNMPMTAIFSVFAVLFGLSVILLRKNKYFLLLVGMLLFGIYITKTDQLPFYEPYKFLYEHVRVLQIFRRPVSKFYWMPLFFYFTVLTVGVGYILDILKKRMKIVGTILVGVMMAAASYWVVLFVKTPLLTPFNIPEYYYSSADVLAGEHARRIAVLPSTFGFQPAFNETIQNYYGIDFLWYIWPYSVIYPDSSSYSPALFFKPLAAALLSDVRDNTSLCETARRLNISHIVVRQDLSAAAKVEDKPEDLIRILNAHPDIVSRKPFGAGGKPGFTLFTLKPECRSSLVQLSGDDSAGITYRMESPVQIKITVTHVSKPVRLEYLTNFTKLWGLLPAKLHISPYRYLYRKTPFYDYHSPVYSYANQWELSPNILKQNLSSDQYTVNSDGSVNADLTLYYLPQLTYYAGALLTVSILLGSFVYILFKHKGKKDT